MKKLLQDPCTNGTDKVLRADLVHVQYDEEEDDGTPMGTEDGDHDNMLQDPFANRSFLANPNERGIKRVGLIYSPRKSWWTGVVLVALSIAILLITLLTAILR